MNISLSERRIAHNNLSWYWQPFRHPHTPSETPHVPWKPHLHLRMSRLHFNHLCHTKYPSTHLCVSLSLKTHSNTYKYSYIHNIPLPLVSLSLSLKSTQSYAYTKHIHIHTQAHVHQMEHFLKSIQYKPLGKNASDSQSQVLYSHRQSLFAYLVKEGG